MPPKMPAEPIVDDYPDDYEDYSDGDFYCEECGNTGELDCHCGGDLCVCENNGTYPCPACS